MPDDDLDALLAEAERARDAELAELEALSDEERIQLDQLVTAPDGTEGVACDEETPKLTDDEWRYVLDMEVGADG